MHRWQHCRASLRSLFIMTAIPRRDVSRDVWVAWKPFQRTLEDDTDGPETDHFEFFMQGPAFSLCEYICVGFGKCCSNQLRDLPGKPQRVAPTQGLSRTKHYTLLYSTLLYSTLLYSTLLYSTLLYSILLYYYIPYHTIPYHTIPYHTIPYHTIPYHTIPYHTIPYHTIPYYTILYYIIDSLPGAIRRTSPGHAATTMILRVPDTLAARYLAAARANKRERDDHDQGSTPSCYPQGVPPGRGAQRWAASADHRSNQCPKVAKRSLCVARLKSAKKHCSNSGPEQRVGRQLVAFGWGSCQTRQKSARRPG